MISTVPASVSDFIYSYAFDIFTEMIDDTSRSPPPQNPGEADRLVGVGEKRKSIWSCFSNLKYGKRRKNSYEELLADLNVYAAVTAGLGSSLSHQNRTQAVN
ncbi:hypothetical protein, partial [uncultured Agathobaculum sp.]|uniref:hypothetical protein n=1 Tax=uncultured Agathobaculum sp. TaxID=2048140 RepID=UPI00296EBF1D